MASDDEIMKIKKKLIEHEERIIRLESSLEQKKEKLIKEVGFDTEASMEKLSKEAGISKEQLRHVFDLEKEDLKLKTTVDGKNWGEKQFKATVCILTAYHYCYSRDEIKSQDLRKKLALLGIRSLENLSSNLAEYKQFILPKGKPKSKNFVYKITYPGIYKGLEIIKELSGA
jgi:hypothetical protein